MKIRPASSVNGTIHLPGDKSISHRAVMFAAIADGVTRIENFAASADCLSTISCMRQLGVRIEQTGTSAVMHGVGRSGLQKSDEPLDCGNSGTTIRLLAGIMAGQNFDSVLTGDGSLRKRPMNRIIGPLEQMGAVIGAVDGHAPLAISGGRPLKGIEYQTPVASAQVKSCVLLAGVFAEGETTVIETVPTRDHTERMLGWFGVRVDSDGMKRSVAGGSAMTANDLTVPGDISSAAYFMVAAACLPGSEIALPQVGVNPTRSAILDVFDQLGIDAKRRDESTNGNEPRATLEIYGGLPKMDRPLIIEGRVIANLIDEIPVLAVLGTQLDHGIEIRDARELRVKESDRISAVVENLNRMGASVTEFDDGFKVERSNLNGAVIDPFGDHRIAMAFAVAGLLARGETEIIGADCVDVSFPGFFEMLGSVVR